MGKRLYVIGIGYKPLEKRAREIILNSSIILASRRLFDVFKGYDEFEEVKDRIKVINNIDETIEFIRTNLQSSALSPQPIVLLASGDPMFFGIGRRITREFGRETLEIIPDLSSIQLAFSKIKEPWDDALLISLHGGPEPEKRRRLPYEIEDLPSLIEKYPKIAILTDKENNPSKIADFLSSALNLQPLALKIYVCERLGYPDEKITEGTPQEIAEMIFSEPNVVILIGAEEQRCRNAAITAEEIKFGLKENEISHSSGLITKDEIRAITIHKLRLPQKGVFWDIGGGSGSVSIEIARLLPESRVFVIEKDEEQIKYIKDNIERYRIANIEIIKGEAPEALKDLPSPERIFIGGSGGRLIEIIEFINNLRWAGIVVINATTVETLDISFKLLKEANYTVDVVQVHISRLKPLGDKHHFSAQSPVFIISAEK